MNAIAPFKEYPPWGRRLDRVFEPLMHLCMGWLNERPQETHYWNNRRFTPLERARLDFNLAQFGVGDYRTRWGDRVRARISRIWPLFHVWILGGCNQYLVVGPTEVHELWYIGWVKPDCSWGGVSLIPLTDQSVRVLLSPESMGFVVFAPDGTQIPLKILGRGRLGDPTWRHVRLR